MFGSCSLFKIYLCQIPPGEAKKDYIWSSEWPRQDIHQLIWTAWMEVWPSTFTWVVIWTTWVDLLSLLWWKPWRTFVLSVIHLSKYKKHLLVSVKTRILKCIKLMIERNANIAGKMKTHTVLVKKRLLPKLNSSFWSEGPAMSVRACVHTLPCLLTAHFV